MPRNTLRIVSRASPLARWQAEHARAGLLRYHPRLEISITGIKTTADRFLDKGLAGMGGKGLFVKELEQAILAGEAELAVHSMKDVPVRLPAGLALPVVMRREEPRDALVSSLSNPFDTVSALPKGARIATSSLRRQCQLRAARPDLRLVDIRGNVNTRLAALDAGDYDALLLAAAGLERLGLASRISEHIAVDAMLPAVGQGALGIEVRADDEGTKALIAALNDEQTARCVAAERAFARTLYGGCHLPIAAYARLVKEDEKLTLTMCGLVGKADGSVVLRQRISGEPEDAEGCGRALAERLLEQGAHEILDEILAGPADAGR